MKNFVVKTPDIFLGVFEAESADEAARFGLDDAGYILDGVLYFEEKRPSACRDDYEEFLTEVVQHTEETRGRVVFYDGGRWDILDPLESSVEILEWERRGYDPQEVVSREESMMLIERFKKKLRIELFKQRTGN